MKIVKVFSVCVTEKNENCGGGFVEGKYIIKLLAEQFTIGQVF